MLMVRGEAPIARRTGAAIAQVAMSPTENTTQKAMRPVLYQFH